MICVFGWRWKEVEKKMSNWITLFLSLSFSFLKQPNWGNRIAFCNWDQFLLLCLLGEGSQTRGFRGEENANQTHGPQPAPSTHSLCSLDGKQAQTWELDNSLLAHTFSVTTPSCRIGSSVPTSFNEVWWSPGLINIQQHVWPTADPQVPPPSSFLSQCRIQGVGMCESTFIGEM